MRNPIPKIPSLKGRSPKSARLGRGGLLQSGRRLFGFFLLPALLCLPSWGQYSIDWSTIDGGGGASTGGTFSVTGTIGQPDAGTMTGGNYSLSGGFWGVIAAVQTPGAPWLSIFRSATNTFIVSWPAPADGWTLEYTNALPSVAVAWPTVPPPYQTNAGTIYLTFTNHPPGVNRFFRLHRQ